LLQLKKVAAFKAIFRGDLLWIEIKSQEPIVLFDLKPYKSDESDPLATK